METPCGAAPTVPSTLACVLKSQVSSSAFSPPGGQPMSARQVHERQLGLGEWRSGGAAAAPLSPPRYLQVYFITAGSAKCSSTDGGLNVVNSICTFAERSLVPRKISLTMPDLVCVRACAHASLLFLSQLICASRLTMRQVNKTREDQIMFRFSSLRRSNAYKHAQ